MLSRALLLLLPVATLGNLSGGFNYNRCDMEYGPSMWPGKCQAQTHGTPINLCGAIPFAEVPTLSAKGYDNPRTMAVENDGGTIKVTVMKDPPTLFAGNLSWMVGRSTDIEQTWVLQQMHIHWGRLGKINEGSEHYLQGTSYAAEAHMVHFNSAYGNFSGAVASGKSDALLVVGVFLAVGSQDQSASITAMADAVTTAGKKATEMSTTVTLSDLFDGTGSFYSYAGSLTTPSCNEIVTWVVIDQPKVVSMATMNKFWQASVHPGIKGAELISKLGNYRPLQTIGSRLLYHSSGATAACPSGVMEPAFMCGSESSASMLSISSLHLAAFLVAILGIWN